MARAGHLRAQERTHRRAAEDAERKKPQMNTDRTGKPDLTRESSTEEGPGGTERNVETSKGRNVESERGGEEGTEGGGRGAPDPPGDRRVCRPARPPSSPGASTSVTPPGNTSPSRLFLTGIDGDGPAPKTTPVRFILPDLPAQRLEKLILTAFLLIWAAKWAHLTSFAVGCYHLPP